MTSIEKYYEILRQLNTTKSPKKMRDLRKGLANIKRQILKECRNENKCNNTSL